MSWLFKSRRITTPHQNEKTEERTMYESLYLFLSPHIDFCGSAAAQDALPGCPMDTILRTTHRRMAFMGIYWNRFKRRLAKRNLADAMN